MHNRAGERDDRPAHKLNGRTQHDARAAQRECARAGVDIVVKRQRAGRRDGEGIIVAFGLTCFINRAGERNRPAVQFYVAAQHDGRAAQSEIARAGVDVPADCEHTCCRDAQSAVRATNHPSMHCLVDVSARGPQDQSRSSQHERCGFGKCAHLSEAHRACGQYARGAAIAYTGRSQSQVAAITAKATKNSGVDISSTNGDATVDRDIAAGLPSKSGLPAIAAIANSNDAHAISSRGGDATGRDTAPGCHQSQVAAIAAIANSIVAHANSSRGGDATGRDTGPPAIKVRLPPLPPSPPLSLLTPTPPGGGDATGRDTAASHQSQVAAIAAIATSIVAHANSSRGGDATGNRDIAAGCHQSQVAAIAAIATYTAKYIVAHANSSRDGDATGDRNTAAVCYQSQGAASAACATSESAHAASSSRGGDATGDRDIAAGCCQSQIAAIAAIAASNVAIAANSSRGGDATGEINRPALQHGGGATSQHDARAGQRKCARTRRYIRIDR